MKIRICTALLIAVLLLSLLAGCSARAAEQKLETLENSPEQRMDTVEDTVEAAAIQAVLPEPAAQPTETLPAPTAPPETTVPSSSATQPAQPLTAEEAKAIALNHAGFTQDQVKFLRAEYEIDDRIPQYDVDFVKGQWEYDYEIHAETGAILSFEKDD